MKYSVLLTSMLIWSVIGLSQSDQNFNDGKFRFGFNVGANYSNLKSKEALENNSKIYNGVGYSFGMFMDYSFLKNFMVSPNAELAFNNCGVESEKFISSPYEIFPVSLNLMVHLAYRIGKGKIVPYIFAGPNFKIPAYKRPDTNYEFYTNKDLAIDFGIGLETRIRNFIISPELKYSYGFLNVNNNPGVQLLYFHNISLTLNFKR